MKEKQTREQASPIREKEKRKSCRANRDLRLPRRLEEVKKRGVRRWPQQNRATFGVRGKNHNTLEEGGTAIP